MSHSWIRAIWLLSLWTVTAAGLVATIVSAGGPAGYSEHSIQRIIGAVFIAVGLLGGPLARLILRLRADRGRTLVDERDRSIEARCTSIGFIVTLALRCGRCMPPRAQRPVLRARLSPPCLPDFLLRSRRAVLARPAFGRAARSASCPARTTRCFLFLRRLDDCASRAESPGQVR